MVDDEYTFSQARARLDELVAEARRKDMSLEQSMDVLDEGVRLINRCTERVDQVEVGDAAGSEPTDDEADQAVTPDRSEQVEPVTEQASAD
jgi:exodeoxyribonuclease VII small subunit